MNYFQTNLLCAVWYDQVVCISASFVPENAVNAVVWISNTTTSIGLMLYSPSPRIISKEKLQALDFALDTFMYL